MKITIEPTDKTQPIEIQNPKISVWIAGDDHNLCEVVEYLVIPALKAYGFMVDDGMITVDLLA